MGKTNQVPVSCAVCATEWTVKASRAAQNNAITCSKACLGELRSRNRIKHFGTAEARRAICPVCKEPFERKPSQLSKYTQSYCSQACRAVGISGPKPEQRTRRWFACAMCGKAIWRTSATERRHVYCSRSCANRDPSIRTPRPRSSGPKHWRWKGGVSFLPYSPGWTKYVRAAVRERDGYQCQICGLATREPGELVVHHKDWGKTNHQPSNLVTLCRSCHARHHHGRLQLD
jgi:5-methylcytosine-specific restriction endonuclease McrA